MIIKNIIIKDKNKNKGSITKKWRILCGSRITTKHRRYSLDFNFHSISDDNDPSRVSIILWRYE
jgi:inorganic pyrophosphatase